MSSNDVSVDALREALVGSPPVVKPMVMIRTVQMLLGHRNIRSTAEYIHITMGRFQLAKSNPKLVYDLLF